MSKDLLPQAQLETLECLEAWPPDRPSPSIRDLMAALGLSSPDPVKGRLARLAEKGYITWQPGKARSIRVLTPGQVWVAVPESRLSLVAAVTAPEPTLADVSAVESWAGQWHRDRRLAGAAEYNPEKVHL